MWAELLLFVLVFIFAAHQFYDLKKEKKKMQLSRKQNANKNDPNVR
jgi:hypothetical protein